MNVCRKEQIEEYGQCGANGQNKERGKASTSLLEILSFATTNLVLYNFWAIQLCVQLTCN
jgi:hypothetical protein